jgi:hypothetical protein
MPPLLHRIAYFDARVCHLLLMVRDRFSLRLPISTPFPKAKYYSVSATKIVFTAAPKSPSKMPSKRLSKSFSKTYREA